MVLLLTWLSIATISSLAKAEAVDALSQLNVWSKGDSVVSPSSIQILGKLNSSWNSTCVLDAAKRGEEPPKTCGDLHTLGIYIDTLTLEYTFEDASLFDFGVPTVTMIGGRAEAKVIDFSTDVEERRGEIQLEHECRPLTPAQIAERKQQFRGDTAALRRADTTLIRLRMSVTKETTLELGWNKVCGHGPHHALDYGIEMQSGSARSLRSATKPEDVVVGPDATATRVYLRTEHGAGASRFRRPFVTALNDRPEVGAVVRSWETFETGAKFMVLYACNGRGRTGMKAMIALPPFENVTILWTKDCGGGAEPSLSVKSRNIGSQMLVEKGVAVSSFATGAPAVQENTLMRGSSKLRFDVSMRDGVTVGVASVESSDSAVIRPRVWIERSVGATVVVVEARCRKVGEAHITVTLPVQDRVPVEWAFYKRCAMRHNPTGQTLSIAGGLVLVGAVLVILGRVVRAMPAKQPMLRKAVRFERVESRTE